MNGESIEDAWQRDLNYHGLKECIGNLISIRSAKIYWKNIDPELAEKLHQEVHDLVKTIEKIDYGAPLPVLADLREKYSAQFLAEDKADRAEEGVEKF